MSEVPLYTREAGGRQLGSATRGGPYRKVDIRLPGNWNFKIDVRLPGQGAGAAGEAPDSSRPL